MTETKTGINEEKIVRILKLEFSEENKLSRIEDSASFDNLLPCYGSKMDISRFYPITVSSAIEHFAEAIGGEGSHNVEKRLEVISRFIEVTKPLMNLDWETRSKTSKKLSSDLFDQLQLKGGDEQKSIISDFLFSYPEKRFKVALEVDPNLRDRMIHLYALSESLQMVSRGIGRVLDLTTAGKSEEEKVLQRVNLYAEHGSKIPSDKLAGLSKEEILTMHEYSEWRFDWDVREIFAKYVSWEDWDKARDLAALALKTYTPLKEKPMEDEFSQKDIDKHYALWEWTNKNFDVLRKEISFVKGPAKK